MVKNLVAKGNLSSPLILFNRTKSRAIELSEALSAPTVIASSIHQAVAPAGTIFICLGDDPAVEQTIAAAVDSGDLSGKLFIDCSTVHPDTTRRIAALLESHGASFAACPVFGAPPAAEAGQLVCVLAGRKEPVSRAKPFFAGVMGRANIDLSETSEDTGRAAMLKVVGNSLIFRMVQAVGDGLVVAEKSGLGANELHGLIELLFPGIFASYSNRMISGEYFKREEPLFAVDLARKDVRHMLDLAKNVGAKVEGVEVLDESLKAVKAHAGEKGDVAGLYGAARLQAGLEYENNK